jgi:Putative proteasome component.
MGPETRQILDRWESVLSRLGSMSKVQGEFLGLDREIDWVIKKGLLDRYAESRSIPSGDGRLRMIDLQYHDIRSDRGLFRLLESRGEVLRILDPQEIEEALLSPPADTRAYFRGTLLRRFPREVVAVSWSSAVVDDGSTSLKRIPLEDPCRGTQKVAGALIERHVTASGLLAELASGQTPGAGSVNGKET